MKLTQFLYDALVSWEYNWDLKPEEYPFKITEEDNYKSLEEKADAWIEEHNLEEVEDKILDFDLEKSYLYKRMVFKLDGHYYAFEYYYSPYWIDYEPVDQELKEVFPVEKTIIVYK